MTTPPISPLAPAPTAAPPLSRFDSMWTTPAMVSTGRGLAGYTPQFTVFFTDYATSSGRGKTAAVIQRDPALVSFESAYAAAYQPVAQRTYPLLPLLSTESLVRLLAWEEMDADTYERRSPEGKVRYPTDRQMRAIHRARPRAALEEDLRALAATNDNYSLFLHGILLPERDLALEDIEEWARWHGLYHGLCPLEKMLAIFRVQHSLMTSSKIVCKIDGSRAQRDRLSTYLASTIKDLSYRLYHDQSGLADDVEPAWLTGYYLGSAVGYLECEREWEAMGAPLGLPLSPGGEGEAEEDEEDEPVEERDDGEEEDETDDEEGEVDETAVEEDSTEEDEESVGEATGDEDGAPSEGGYQTDSLDCAPA